MIRLQQAVPRQAREIVLNFSWRYIEIQRDTQEQKLYSDIVGKTEITDFRGLKGGGLRCSRASKAC